jgi:hypothetical protein
LALNKRTPMKKQIVYYRTQNKNYNLTVKTIKYYIQIVKYWIF